MTFLFCKLCAGRTGQLLNLTGLGNELGINYKTVDSWLSILEISFIVYLLKPHFAPCCATSLSATLLIGAIKSNFSFPGRWNTLETACLANVVKIAQAIAHKSKGF